MHYTQEFGGEESEATLVIHKRDYAKDRPYEIELYDDECDISGNLTEEQAKQVYTYLGQLLGIE